MPRAKKRKNTSFETKQVKSVFLYGEPNKGKLEALLNLQKTYTDAVSRFVQLIDGEQSLFMQVVMNNKHDGAMRAFEKQHRCMELGSAMSQAAFDDAVTMLSNRMENIRLWVLEQNDAIFARDKTLFAMAFLEEPQENMSAVMEGLAESSKSEQKKAHYREMLFALRGMTQEEFRSQMLEFMDGFRMAEMEYRVPEVKKAWVSIDSRTYSLQEPCKVKTAFVARITVPSNKGKRIEVPVNTSRNSLRRMAQYGYAKSARYTITRSGKLKLMVAFEKHVAQPATVTVVGVDTGMKDCLYASDGRHYGTMDAAIDYYVSTVEPSFAGLSGLRNKKRKIRHYIRRHKNLPDKVRRSLLAKVGRLDRMIQTAKEPYHKNRHYYQMVDDAVCASVKGYVSGIDKNTLTAVEKLDLRSPKKSKEMNERLSLFARGKLHKKLLSTLNWKGYDFVEVEPAYTSTLCPVCNLVDKENRNGKVFLCKCCGHTADADENAGVNIRDRATDEEVSAICEKDKRVKDRHKDLKSLYARRHLQWMQGKKDGKGSIQASA